MLAKTVTKAKVATKAKTEVKKTDSKLTKTKEFDRKSGEILGLKVIDVKDQCAGD